MRTIQRLSALAGITFATLPVLYGQGYIVPNAVIYNGNHGVGYEIDVEYNPTNHFYTGFFLNPVALNTFAYDHYLDIGIRVFLVTPNQPVSLEPILANQYTELQYPNTYMFASGVPFYLGLYTGNMQYPPPNGIYSDPLFGWVELVNDKGVIEMLDSALAYNAAGIYAGTQNIIEVPEPNVLSLVCLGCLLVGAVRRKAACLL